MNKLLQTLMVTIALVLFSCSADAAVSVIVNKDNTNDVSNARIKQLFTLRKSTFKDGQVAQLYIPAAGDSRELFLKRLLFYSEARLNKRYQKMVKANKGVAPIESSDREILAAVTENINAIGVIDSSLVTPDVKVVAMIEQ